MTFKNPQPTQNGRSLANDLRDKRCRWQAELEQCGLEAAGACLAALPVQLAAAGHDMVVRLGLAMLQEGILHPGPGGEVMSLPGDDGVALVLRGPPPDAPSLFPAIELVRRDGKGAETAVEDPIELLALVAPAVPGASPEVLSRLVGEVADAMRNDALCRAYRAGWNDRLRGADRSAARASLWDWLKERPNQPAQAVKLEQWSATGHPYHPTHKTRLGMTPGEVLAFCPEFEPRVPVGLLAARRPRVRGGTMAGASAMATWLDDHFPQQAAAWRNGLADAGHDPVDYIALPVHPWQAQHEIPRRFPRALAAGDLIALPGLVIPCNPLTSVRTLSPVGMEQAPHLKLSLAVRLTSVERTISPRSCEMGPRVSRLLQDLIGSDAALSSTLDILPEETGLYFAAAEKEEAAEARHLAALLRTNPSRRCGADDVVIPTTALTVASPSSGAPLFLEIAGADSLGAFTAYAEALLRPLLILYLRYGIGLEAHQQNSLAVYSRGGALRRFLLRDFGGIRIHEPTFRAAGLELELHADRLTVVDDREEVRSKLTSRTFHYHIGFLISRICRHLGTPERLYWAAVAAVVQGVFDELRGGIDAGIWEREHAALLHADWGTKTSLRMRFEGVSGDIYLAGGANPLRWGR